MRRFTPRDLTLYLLLALMLVFTFSTLQQMDREDSPTYSEILTCFYQEQVEYFTLKDNTLTLTLRGNQESGSATVTYQVARPDWLYQDLHELWDSQYAKGILLGYDIPPGVESAWWYNLIPYGVVIAVVVLFWVWMVRQRNAAAGGGGAPGASRFGRARTRTLSDQAKKVTFADVAGADEEKEELQEIVEFLRDPQKYSSLGARIPKGVLLVGPPGTGKTLIAKAVAGEAGVHFLSISGSDFVELYVGVGASRVRDLFDQAKKEAPAIVFIDEIDAVGRQRGAGLGGGHDEREQTLNQLLVEMDGFGSNEGVIVLAATNRQDILDPALLRPGRFDRQIYVGLPDIRGREEILKVHARKKPLSEDASLSDIAKATAGFTGADLENLLNEAALLAARANQRFITMSDLHEAMMKVIAGPEKKSRVVTPLAKRLTAYHEAGHALIQAVIDDGRLPVHKVTIIPRGQSLGSTMFVPSRDIRTESKKSLLNHICTSLGGRVAEEAVFTDITNGAAGDIKQATKIARKMVCDWGMGEIGPIALGENQDHIFLGKEIARDEHFSEKTAQLVDGEIKAIVDGQLERARKIVRENRGKLDLIASELLLRETIEGEDVYKIVRGEFTPTDPEEFRRRTEAAAPSAEAEAAAKPEEDGGEIIAPPLPENG